MLSAAAWRKRESDAKRTLKYLGESSLLVIGTRKRRWTKTRRVQANAGKATRAGACAAPSA